MQPHKENGCEHCNSTGIIESDNNGPIVACPVCNPEPSQDDKQPTEQELIELIQHCWIHSGYENCGYRQMTTRQKQIFDDLTINQPF